jgi:arylsulfatase A-like enzyme
MDSRPTRFGISGSAGAAPHALPFSGGLSRDWGEGDRASAACRQREELRDVARPHAASRRAARNAPAIWPAAAASAVPAWDKVLGELRPILSRQMESYAAFLKHTDHHVGRLVDALKDMEVLDDTLMFYIIGDNGAPAVGNENSVINIKNKSYSITAEVVVPQPGAMAS